MAAKVQCQAGLNTVVAAKHGYMLFNRQDRYIGRSLAAYGEYCEHEVHLFQHLCRPGDVVIEAGANIGAHTVPLAQAVGPQGTVHAIEPQRVVFQNLCANIALNGLLNVQCHHAGAGASPGTMSLPALDYAQPANFGGVHLTPKQSGEAVSIRRLDDFLELPSLRLLKVDVEGMERDVLAGADGLVRRHKPFLYVENDRAEHSRPLIEDIDALGYRMFWHITPLYNCDNHAGNPENLFPQLVSVNLLCCHRSVEVDIRGMPEVRDPNEHPILNNA